MPPDQRPKEKGPPDGRAFLPCATPVADGERFSVGPWPLQALHVPGHTRSHVAFFVDALPGFAPVLFSGDTLFSLGCGRLFEGTPAQMHASLTRLAALPGATRLCCGHEYTLANAAFAAAVDPGNAALARRTQEATAMRERHIIGNPTEVKAQLDALVEESGAQELMITTNTVRHADRVRSYQLLAEAFALGPHVVA